METPNWKGKIILSSIFIFLDIYLNYGCSLLSHFFFNLYSICDTRKAFKGTICCKNDLWTKKDTCFNNTKFKGFNQTKTLKYFLQYRLGRQGNKKWNVSKWEGKKSINEQNVEKIVMKNKVQIKITKITIKSAKIKC